MKKITNKNKKISFILKINKKINSTQEYLDIIKFQVSRLNQLYSKVIILDLDKKLEEKNFQTRIINNVKELKIWINLQ